MKLISRIFHLQVDPPATFARIVSRALLLGATATVLVASCGGGAGPGSDGGNGSTVDSSMKDPTMSTCGSSGQVCCTGSLCLGNLACQANVCTAPARTGEVGKPCQKNGDCASGICLPVGQPVGPNGATGNACTAPCTGNACTAGWSCQALLGQATNVCQCHYAAEACNGLDDDCDGIVDNADATDAICQQSGGPTRGCVAGACGCKAPCGGACVDQTSDVANCGACNHACTAPTNAVARCSASTCGFQCKSGYADCDSSAANGCEADLQNDGKNCGACNTDCHGDTCAHGLCVPACQAGNYNGTFTGMDGDLPVTGTLDFVLVAGANESLTLTNGTMNGQIVDMMNGNDAIACTVSGALSCPSKALTSGGITGTIGYIFFNENCTGTLQGTYDIASATFNGQFNMSCKFGLGSDNLTGTWTATLGP